MNFETIQNKILPKTKRASFKNSISRSISLNELAGGANDVIIVKKENAQYVSTPLNIVIGKLSSSKTIFSSRRKNDGRLFINGCPALTHSRLMIGKSGVVYIKRHKQSFCFTTEEINRMQLNNGINPAVFVVDNLSIKISFAIYLFSCDSKFIVSDIDGTITRSDLVGFVGGSFGLDVHHKNVIRFLHKVHENGYNVMYLSARPIAFDQGTREYLFSHLQNGDGGYSLPLGPLFLNSSPTDRLGISDPSVIKIGVLKTFLNMFTKNHDTIVGAYGNKETDTTAYLNAGISPNKIYLLGKNSKILNVGTKQEYSYTELAYNVDRFYPKRNILYSI